MKHVLSSLRLSLTLVSVLFAVSGSPLLNAAVQVWDPDGSTPGTGISGNWDTTTANWTTAPDAGGNTTWTQGNDASFNMASNYTVTVTAPITVANITLSGSAGTLTITNDSANVLTLGGSSVFLTGGRAVVLGLPITGGFDLTRGGGGTVTLFGASTYSGGTTWTNGTFALGVDSVSSGSAITSGPLGTGPVTITNVAVTLTTSGGARVLDNPVTLGANLTISGSSPITLRNGDWKLAGAGRTITVSSTADVTLQSRLTDDGTARTLTKGGTGKLILAGDNSSFLGNVTLANNGGTIALGNPAGMPTNAVLTLNTNCTLDLNGFDCRVNRLVGQSVIGGAGLVLLGTNTLTAGNNSSSSEFSGVISGTGRYVKVGTISQVLSGTNTFTGGITITQGSVYFPTNGSDPSTNIALGPGPNTITITGTGRWGVNRGAAVVTNPVVLLSPTGGLDSPSGSLHVQAGEVTGPGGLIRTSQGSGWPVFTASNSFSGGLEMDERNFVFGHPRSMGTGPLLLGNPGPTVLPTNAIRIAGYGVDLTGANAITNPVTINHSFTMEGNAIASVLAPTNLEFSGPVTLASGIHTNTTTGLGGTPLFKFSGVIGGSGGMNKAGDNVLVLSANNTYTGPTIVSGGTLSLSNAGAFNLSSNIDVEAGATLDASGRSDGTLTVGAAQTLSGLGVIAGNVIVNGTLSPGSPIGMLTFNNNLTLANKTLLEIDKSSVFGANDTVMVGGTLTGGGTLTVVNVGSQALTNGDSFQLFSQPVSGFTSVSLPAGYTWNNQLATAGSITVISRNWPTTPTNATVSLSGSNITVSWPANYAGGWVLETSPDLVNWTDVPNTRDVSSISFPAADAPQGFYRLRLVTE